MRSLFEIVPLPLPLEPAVVEAEDEFLRSPNAALLSFVLLRDAPDVEGLTGANLGRDTGRRGCGREDEGASRARGLNPTSSG